MIAAGVPRLPRHGVSRTNGIFELLEMKTAISELVRTRAAGTRFYEAARADGMVPLREECLALVSRGETTLEEVLRVTHDWRPAAAADTRTAATASAD